VIRFYLRALRAAERAGDGFSLQSATRADELAKLIDLARGRRRVVELGTGTGWTAIALALAATQEPREVITYDPIPRPERDIYLRLVPGQVQARIRFVEQGAEEGPRPGTPPADMVFLDSSHERDETLATFRAWEPALAPGAVVAFHDYDEPAYPGVTEAVEELGLRGQVYGHLFIWRAP
jgi:predicted O-methyltransferase YrrM